MENNMNNETTSNIISGDRDQHWFNVTLGHGCYSCHRWIKIGERAFYQRNGDSGTIRCEACMTHDFKFQEESLLCASCDFAQNDPLHDIA